MRHQKILAFLFLSLFQIFAFAQTEISPVPRPPKPPVDLFPVVPDAKVVCETSCTGAVTTMKFIDDRGTCGRTVNLPCYPYACHTGGKYCNKTCTENSQCATGSVCNKASGQCVIPTYRCGDDGESVVGSDGSVKSCGGFACRGGACIMFCNEGYDCAAAYNCDPTNRTCIRQGSGE